MSCEQRRNGWLETMRPQKATREEESDHVYRLQHHFTSHAIPWKRSKQYEGKCLFRTGILKPVWMELEVVDEPPPQPPPPLVKSEEETPCGWTISKEDNKYIIHSGVTHSIKSDRNKFCLLGSTDLISLWIQPLTRLNFHEPLAITNSKLFH